MVRYVNFLCQFQRFDDALIVAKTCKKPIFDNGQIGDMIDQIEGIKKRMAQEPANNAQITSQLQQMQTEAREHSTNVQNLLMLGNAFLQMQRTNEAVTLFNQALTNSSLSYQEPPPSARLTASWAATTYPARCRAFKTVTVGRTHPAGSLLRPRRAQGRLTGTPATRSPICASP